MRIEGDNSCLSDKRRGTWNACFVHGSVMTFGLEVIGGRSVNWACSVEPSMPWWTTALHDDLIYLVEVTGADEGLMLDRA